MLTKIKTWLAARLGVFYAPAVETLDRALSVFVLAFAAKAVASDLFDVHHILVIGYWETAALAGAAAALTVIQSAISTYFTGTPALLGFMSRTLRSRRDLGRRPEHAVPVLRKAA